MLICTENIENRYKSEKKISGNKNKLVILNIPLVHYYSTILREIMDKFVIYSFFSYISTVYKTRKINVI